MLSYMGCKRTIHLIFMGCMRLHAVSLLEQYMRWRRSFKGDYSTLIIWLAGFIMLFLTEQPASASITMQLLRFVQHNDSTKLECSILTQTCTMGTVFSLPSMQSLPYAPIPFMKRVNFCFLEPVIIMSAVSSKAMVLASMCR